MKWISVFDELPNIPEGKRSVSVLVAVFDPTYNELNPGRGYDVFECMYGNVDGRDYFQGKQGNDFMDLYIGGDNTQMGPIIDEVTHWMYLPEPPIIDEDK